MRLGILQADRVDPENRARFGDYPKMVVDVLGKDLGEGASFDFFDVRRDQYPKRIGTYDGYLITGSRASVYDDEPWIVRLADFVRELDDAGAKTIGVCFGHQLIAHALGGAVDRAPNGWGVGVQTWKVVSDEPWMRPARNALCLLASHQDQVQALPPRGRLLAASEFCPLAAFVVDDHMLGIQGHPEFTREYAEFLMHRRRNELGAAFDPGLRSLHQPTDEDVVAAWITRFVCR